MGSSSSTQQVFGILSGGFEAKLNKGVLTITKAIDLNDKNATMTLHNSGFLHNSEEEGSDNVLRLDISKFTGYKEYVTVEGDDNVTEVPADISQLTTHPIYTEELEKKVTSELKVSRLETTTRISTHYGKIITNLKDKNAAMESVVIDILFPEGAHHYELLKVLIEQLTPTQKDNLGKGGNRATIGEEYTDEQIKLACAMIENVLPNKSSATTQMEDVKRISTAKILEELKSRDFELLCIALDGKKVGEIQFPKLNLEMQSKKMTEIQLAYNIIYNKLSTKVDSDEHTQNRYTGATKTLAENLYKIIHDAYENFDPRNYVMRTEIQKMVRDREMEEARNLIID